VSIAFYSFFPDQYNYLLPFWYLEFEWLPHFGAALAIVSFVWIIIAQNQMAKSWRIGIDYSETTVLKTNGLFNVSRNPIFLGVLVSYLGTFLVIPNALSFTILLVTYVVIQIQVRLEEEFLKTSHGQEYLDYIDRVRRWI
jgi:protein-S-isoprenylcysteine O-methyltransferase Ste14